MSANMSCPGPDLLLLQAHGLLEDPEEARVGAHTDACDACQAQQATLGEAMQAPPAVEPSPKVLEDLHARIAEHEAEVRATPDAAVHLLCTYCKDDLKARETVYCASCVAPHHEDCFYEHSRCAAPGCEGRRIVRSVEAPQRPAAEPKPKADLRKLWLVLGIVIGGGVAANLPDLSDQGVRVVEVPGSEFGAERAEVSAPKLGSEPGPDRLDLSSLVAQEAAEEDESWKERYRQILEARSVTLNFPDTPLSEVVMFLQDITGLNIAVSSKLDPEEVTVSLRLRDVLLKDALATICELARVSAVLEDEALVIVPLRPETREERLARVAREGVAPPEEAFAVRRRLDSQSISLSFDATPFMESIDFLRDITGLNWVVKDPRSVEDQEVSLRLSNTSLRSAISLILKGRGLGLRLSGSGILWIVPEAEATEGLGRAKEVAALLATAAPGQASPDDRLSGLAERLRAALPMAHVVLTERATRSECRVVLPGGRASVRDLLDLARRQASLNHAVTWLGDKPVLALDASLPGAMVRSRELATLELPGTGQGAVVHAWQGALLHAWRREQAALAEAHDGLDDVARGTADLDDLRAALGSVEEQTADLEALFELSAALKGATPEGLATARERVSTLLARYQAERVKVREHTLAESKRRREAEAAHKTRLAHAEEEAAEQERKARTLEDQLDQLRERVEALDRQVSEDPSEANREAAQQARAMMAKVEDELFAMARQFDEERKLLEGIRETHRSEAARAQRDAALQTARLESERAQLLARVRDAFPGAVVLHDLAQVAEALAKGEGHDVLSDYVAWRKAATLAAGATLGRAIERRGSLGLGIGAREGAEGLWILSDGPAGLRAGDRVATDWYGVYVGLGAESPTLEVERDGQTLRVELGPAAPPQRR